MSTKRRRPSGLGTRGAAFWGRVVDAYDLSDAEAEVLAESCRLLDEIRSLQTALDEGEIIVAGAAGQPKVHPALPELRQHRLALGRLLSQLDLPDEDGVTTLPSAATLRARRAARSRWDRTAAVRAQRTDHGSLTA